MTDSTLVPPPNGAADDRPRWFTGFRRQRPRHRRHRDRGRDRVRPPGHHGQRRRRNDGDRGREPARRRDHHHGTGRGGGGTTSSVPKSTTTAAGGGGGAAPGTTRPPAQVTALVLNGSGGIKGVACVQHQQGQGQGLQDPRTRQRSGHDRQDGRVLRVGVSRPMPRRWRPPSASRPLRWPPCPTRRPGAPRRT